MVSVEDPEDSSSSSCLCHEHKAPGEFGPNVSTSTKNTNMEPKTPMTKDHSKMFPNLWKKLIEENSIAIDAAIVVIAAAKIDGPIATKACSVRSCRDTIPDRLE